MTPFYVVLVIVIGFVYLLPLWVGWKVGASKYRAGFAWAFFLGWIGVLIVALLPKRPGPDDGACPWCTETISVRALVCPHCQREVTPLGADGEPDYSVREELVR